MTLYERFWDCPACGTKGISALRKRKCPSCGHSKTSQDAEHRSRIEITDADGIALARGGPNWVCSRCGSVNLNKYTLCESCGSQKDEKDHTNEVRELGRSSSPSYRPPDITEQFYAPVDPVVSELPPADPVQSNVSVSAPTLGLPSQIPTVAWRPVLLALAAVLGLLGLGWAVFHTTEASGSVTGFSWTRDVTIERYQTIHDSGWSQPAGAYNVSSERKIRSWEPIYETQVDTVHHSQMCDRDLGNGAEESYDCSYDETVSHQVKVGDKPIYDTWYEYDLDTWRFERSHHAGANDRDPYWPQYSLYLDGQTIIGAERVGGTSESYTVYFRTVHDKEPKDYTYQTTQAEWMQYLIEAEYPLKVNSFNAIMNNPLKDKEANLQD